MKCSTDPSGYDIVVDINNNGRYDVTTDVLQKARIDAYPSQHCGVFVLPLPEYWSGTILGLTSFFAALGLLGLIKGRHAAKPDHVATRQPKWRAPKTRLDSRQIKPCNHACLQWIRYSPRQRNETWNNINAEP